MSINSYLKKLRFDKSLEKTFWGRYLKNFRITFLLIVSILVFGIINFLDIPRRLNPEIKIPIVTVVTIYPGAASSEIEKLITNPLEKEIKNIKDIDSFTSSSVDGRSVITIQFLSTVDSKEAEDRVKDAVSKVQNLPDDSQEPNINSVDFENRPVWIFAIYGKNNASLMTLAKNLKEKLENERYIDEVILSGYAEERVKIVFNKEKLQTNKLNPLLIIPALKQQFNAFPLGKIKDSEYEYNLIVEKNIYSLDDIRNLPIRTPDNQTITLSQIAEVYNEFEEKPPVFYADNKTKTLPAVQFSIYRNKAYNIDEVYLKTKEFVNDFLKNYGNEYKLANIENQAQRINDQFSELFKESINTIILVFFVLLIFLGIKQAIIAALTIPLTFFAAIGLLNTFGLSLNFLTLFSFLLTLGLLIDDTIVVVTAMTRYFATKKFTPYQTGVLVIRDFFIPLWSTTATTIWSFVPLLLSTGLIGEFIKPIPVVVSLTMLSSTSIAVLITVPLMIVALDIQSIPARVKKAAKISLALLFLTFLLITLPKNLLGLIIFCLLSSEIFLVLKHKGLIIKTLKKINLLQRIYKLGKKLETGIINTERLSAKYRTFLEKILNDPSLIKGMLSFLVVFGLLGYLLIPFGLLKTEFFPKTDQEIIYVSLEFPYGTKKQIMIEKTKKVVEKIRRLPELKTMTIDFEKGLNERQARISKSNSTLITLNIGKEETRKRESFIIAEALRKELKQEENDFRVNVQAVSGGPPAGADIQISILGDDYKELITIARKAQEFLKKDPDVLSADISYQVGNGNLSIKINPEKLNKYGLSKQEVISQINLYTQKIKVEEAILQGLNEITFEASFKEKISLSELNKIIISSPAGEIPLLELGELTFTENPINLEHEDGKRKVTVYGFLKKGVSTSEKNRALEEFIKSQKLSSQIELKTGGVNEENQRSVQSILRAMLVAFLLILATMVLVFNSYRQAFIVMLNIPLSVAGVFYIFALTSTPLSFPSLIGILALFGIVVTNAIVVIEKINLNIREGFELKEAVVNASTSRLEPVLLTSLTTIFGLLPITISDPLWRGLGGAIIAGLSLSGIIKLFFIPLTYYLIYKKPHKSH